MNQQNAIDLHYIGLFAVAGRSVTFTQGGESASITAAVGSRTHEVDSEFGLLTIDTRDYICKAEDLVISGSTVKPQMGDTITETIGDDDYVFEVVNTGNDACYEQADPSKKYLRIRTQLVSNG